MWSWQMRSSSAVVTPGFTWGATTWSTSAARRPATRIFSRSAGVLSSIDIRPLSPSTQAPGTPYNRPVHPSGWPAMPGDTGKATPVDNPCAGVLRKEFGRSDGREAQPRDPSPALVAGEPSTPFRTADSIIGATAMPQITMRQMLEAGVHFGHQTRYWNPKMAPY